MMHCHRCGGRVFIDRVFSQLTSMELFCILCGRRWMISKETNSFGRWLEQKDREYRKGSSISS
jgi:hypothetical protein